MRTDVIKICIDFWNRQATQKHLGSIPQVFIYSRRASPWSYLVAPAVMPELMSLMGITSFIP